jgi:hypothetical protein
MVALMPFPATLEALEQAGYRRSNYSRCKGCRAPIEWWWTPSHESIPMETMAHPDSAAISHWARCPNAKDFRKETPCPTDHSQLPLLLSEPPQSSVKHTEKKSSEQCKPRWKRPA